jgi:hypothetical protein
MNARGRVGENLARVRDRIAKAAVRGGRAADAVTLVAVTKYVSIEWTAALVEAGCRDLGESRPQALWSKASSLGPQFPPDGIRWHLIGHLQRNKIRRTLPWVHLLHSLDSPRLAESIEQEAGDTIGPPLSALVEVNVSGDRSKTGLPGEELEPLLVAAAGMKSLSIRGLMCMAALDGGRETARRDFAHLRELRDAASANLPPGISLAELSMGMSGDFEEAILEGATLVRIGSALFEGLEP